MAMLWKLCILIWVVMVLLCCSIIITTEQRLTPVVRVVYVQHDVEALIRQVWGDKADIAIAIAKAESALKADAIGDNHLVYKVGGKQYGDSVGIFQIRTFPDRPPKALLLDPYFNINYAFQLYQQQGLRAWSAYTNGSYLQFIQVQLLTTQSKRSI